MLNKKEFEVECKIRKMQLYDIGDVIRIEEKSFTSPWSYWIFFQELITPERFYIVAEVDGEIVGYAGLMWVLDEGHITTIAVKESFRRKGIGSKLLKSIIEKARSLNLSFLTLEVRESNEAAKKLYEKFGFKVEGVRKKYYTRPTEDALIMTLYL